MPRPIDHQRRAALLDAAVDYAVEHGFAELSWRPVAQALGVSVTTLVHHFGTKEHMLETILGRVRDRIFVATAELAGAQPDLPAAARAIWEWSSTPRHRAMFGLFFAVYGRALQQPELFGSFLDHVVEDWMTVLEGCLPAGTPAEDGRTSRTLVIAVLRGLILDLLTTGDEHRVGQALEAFLITLNRSDPGHEPQPAKAWSAHLGGGPDEGTRAGAD